MKICTKCNLEKEDADFGRRANGRNGLQRNCKKCLSEYVAGRSAKDPISVLVSLARKRAIEAQVPFDISNADINLPECCPVFGFELKFNKGRSGPDSYSLDRINPKLGYVRGNIQIISMLANRMKQNATFEQLRQFADWILEPVIPRIEALEELVAGPNRRIAALERRVAEMNEAFSHARFPRAPQQAGAMNG